MGVPLLAVMLGPRMARSCAIGAAIGRELHLSTSLVVLVLVQTTFFGFVVVMAGMRGSPRNWPWALVGLTIVGGVLASIIWWWVDRDIEGRVLVKLTENHGVSTGDLLSVPMLVVSALVLVFACSGPRDRSGR